MIITKAYFRAYDREMHHFFEGTPSKEIIIAELANICDTFVLEKLEIYEATMNGSEKLYYHQPKITKKDSDIKTNQ
jgi:hypothetical protein